MNPFEYTSALQYKVKSLAQQIAEFKSGERYRKLEEEYKSIIRKLEKNIRELKQELAQARKEIRSVRNQWMEALQESSFGYWQNSNIQRIRLISVRRKR